MKTNPPAMLLAILLSAPGCRPAETGNEPARDIDGASDTTDSTDTADSDVTDDSAGPDLDTPLCINEFMAWNKNTIWDQNSDPADWIELFNLTSKEIDLLGWSMTDDFKNPTRHVFGRSLFVPANGWLLLWADQDLDHYDHLDFELERGGEQIGLYDPDGNPVDRIAYSEQVRDWSGARFPDGTGDWQFDETPTPGASNVEAP